MRQSQKQLILLATACVFLITMVYAFSYVSGYRAGKDVAMRDNRSASVASF
jgi:uncharacterized protein involved in exopolysaccharide biosynthesis